jgi:hypothetical protein
MCIATTACVAGRRQRPSIWCQETETGSRQLRILIGAYSIGHRKRICSSIRVTAMESGPSREQPLAH